MNQHSRKINRPLRFLAGWCGLVLYVGAFSPIGMGVAALLGTMDANHHALFEPGPQGLRLVLHHEGNCCGHRHGIVAHALTIFAGPPRTTDPDHVLQFSSATSLTRDAQAADEKANHPEPSALNFGGLGTFVATRSAEYILPPRPPPPNRGGNLLAVRFTVFLI